MSASLTVTITCDDCGTICTRNDVANATEVRRSIAAEGWMFNHQACGFVDYCPRCVQRRMNKAPSGSAIRRARALKGAATKRRAAA